VQHTHTVCTANSDSLMSKFLVSVIAHWNYKASKLKKINIWLIVFRFIPSIIKGHHLKTCSTFVGKSNSEQDLHWLLLFPLVSLVPPLSHNFTIWQNLLSSLIQKKKNRMFRKVIFFQFPVGRLSRHLLGSFKQKKILLGHWKACMKLTAFNCVQKFSFNQFWIIRSWK
jgi:hypothetical protein